MVEFLIASVALLAVFAGLLQIATLGKAKDETMNNARRIAGSLALTPLTTPYHADFIRHWNAGQDERPYSVDDRYNLGSEADFRDVIVSEVVAENADWAVLDAIDNNALSVLHDSGNAGDHIGLVRGSDQETVPLLPAVRHLLYGAPDITVRSEVYMTSTRGIF
jgi:hypothetical protein